MKSLFRFVVPILVGAIAIGILTYVGWRYLVPHPAPMVSAPIQTHAALGEYHWEEEIRTLGAEQAYQKLLTSYASSTGTIQHREAHDFGRMLYQERGKDGFTVCTDAFNGGCLHEFLGTIIKYEGVQIVHDLNIACLKKYGATGAISCQHGFGHGLVAYYGYTELELTHALTICSNIEEANPTKGCFGGAFMEYDSRTMAEGKIRPFDVANPFALCKKIGKEYQHACYYWSAQWMLEVLYEKDFGVTAFAGVGKRCQTLPDTDARSCFEGLGYFAPPAAEFVRAKAKALCMATSASPEYQSVCWDEASQNVRD